MLEWQSFEMWLVTETLLGLFRYYLRQSISDVVDQHDARWWSAGFTYHVCGCRDRNAFFGVETNAKDHILTNLLKISREQFDDVSSQNSSCVATYSEEFCLPTGLTFDAVQERAVHSCDYEW